MKKIMLTILIVGAFVGLLYARIVYRDMIPYIKDANPSHSGQNEEIPLRDGDLIFQISLSGQGKAIQLATGSYYTHCGIIFLEKGKPYVFEAVQPVKRTPLRVWVERGKDKHYVVKRLKNADNVLNAETMRKMKEMGKEFQGKDYDLKFEWNDKKMYCSELIWKIYKRGAGIEIGKPEKLGSFDLSDAIVVKKLKERYGNKIPLNEIVISPASIFSSDALVKVKSN